MVRLPARSVVSMGHVLFLRLVLFCLLVLVLVSARPTLASPAVSRYYPPPVWILGPWLGWIGDESSVRALLNGFERNHLPLAVFHFDWYTWQTCPGSAQFKFSRSLLNYLKRHGMRALFWYVPLISTTCPDYASAAGNHYFVEDETGAPIVTDNFTGHGSWVDFGKPEAVNWLHGKWDALLASTTISGVQVTGGFYIDNVRPELPHGAATDYGNAFARDLLDYTRAHIPDGDVVMKYYGENTPDSNFLVQYAHTAYIGDMTTDFAGMREGIRKVTSLVNVLPAPFNEFTGNAYSAPDSETYIRRLHWGAMQAIMDKSSAWADSPWQSGYTPAVLEAYRFYAALHAELVPYLYSYDRAAFENDTPLMTAPYPKEFSLEIGDELFAKYVTAYSTSVQFTLPAGTWINYWNERQRVTGPKKITQSVPPGREPIWIRSGAILPLAVRDDATGDGSEASRGALTLRVYPDGVSNFHYYDTVNGWVIFQSARNGKGLTLCSTQNAPSQPLIYEIEQWKKKPGAVSLQDGAVGVNRTWGAALPKRKSARQLQGSQGGWYYDAAAKKLWVKVNLTGTGCPSD